MKQDKKTLKDEPTPKKVTEFDETDEEDEEEPTEEGVDGTKSNPAVQKEKEHKAMMENMPKAQMEAVKGILANSLLIAYTKKVGIDGVQEAKKELFKEITWQNNSFMVMNPENTTSLLVNTKYTSGRHTTIGIALLKEVIGCMTKEQIEEAQLIVSPTPNYPCFIGVENNVIAIAPKQGSD